MFSLVSSVPTGGGAGGEEIGHGREDFGNSIWSRCAAIGLQVTDGKKRRAKDSSLWQLAMNEN